MCMMLVPTISFADSSTVTLESILSANGIDINDFDGYELREVKRKSSNGVNAFSSEGTFAGDALVFKKSQGNLYTETMLIIYDTSNNIITPNPRARMMTLKKLRNIDCAEYVILYVSRPLYDALLQAVFCKGAYAGIDAGSNLAVDVKTNKHSWSDGAAALPYASMNPGD